MASPVFYRAEAERCRRLASETSEAEKKRLLALAEDYVRLAEELEQAPPPKE
jgi:hypothetical protein